MCHLFNKHENNSFCLYSRPKEVLFLKVIEIAYKNPTETGFFNAKIIFLKSLTCTFMIQINTILILKK